jgi:hypothetical protein
LNLITHRSFLIFIDFEETYMNFRALIFFHQYSWFSSTAGHFSKLSEIAYC